MILNIWKHASRRRSHCLSSSNTRFDVDLDAEALAFVAFLHRRFNSKRLDFLKEIGAVNRMVVQPRVW
jgi:hypothetical protein